MPESLILKERAEVESAPFLFPDGDLPQIDRAKPKFHCTGERLYRDRPDVYKAVVRMRAEPGVSIREICRTLHVTDDTVRSVAERESIAIAAHKKAILSNITHGLRLASERVIEVMPTASAKDALIGVGILTDKMQLLTGEATVRVEEVQRVDIFSDWDSFVHEQLEPGNVREIGSVRGNLSAKSGYESDAATLPVSDSQAVEGAKLSVGVSERADSIRTPGEAAMLGEVQV